MTIRSMTETELDGLTTEELASRINEVGKMIQDLWGVANEAVVEAHDERHMISPEANAIANMAWSVFTKVMDQSSVLMLQGRAEEAHDAVTDAGISTFQGAFRVGYLIGKAGGELAEWPCRCEESKLSTIRPFAKPAEPEMPGQYL